MTLATRTAPCIGAPPPPLDDFCPRCEGRIDRIVRIAREAAEQVVITKADADAVAVEADRLAREELADAGGCWG